MPDKLVFVNGYHRSDGTYVDPHFRRYPVRSIYHDPDRPPYNGAEKYTPREIREMQDEARKKLQELKPRLEDVSKRIDELRAERRAAFLAGDREKAERVDDRAHQMYKDEYVPLLRRVERQQEIVDDPPVWKPMPDT